MKDSIIKTVPAAEALRKVPQFNPLRYLRQTTSRKTGEPVLKLDLRFKKMWFRLACADGRMVLTPMRITDSMAIFEAQVYLHGDDPKPIANFVSTMYAADVPGGRYIQAAQDEALNEALDNAGFVDCYRTLYPDVLEYPGFTFPSDNPLMPESKLTWAPEADERDRIDYVFYHPHPSVVLKEAVIFGPDGSIVKSRRVKETSRDRFLLPLGVWPTDHKGLLVTFGLKR